MSRRILCAKTELAESVIRSGFAVAAPLCRPLVIRGYVSAIRYGFVKVRQRSEVTSIFGDKQIVLPGRGNGDDQAGHRGGMICDGLGHSCFSRSASALMMEWSSCLSLVFAVFPRIR